MRRWTAVFAVSVAVVLAGCTGTPVAEEILAGITLPDLD